MASKQRIPEKIRQEAARWITEGDAGLLTSEDEVALDAWLASDPLNALAYARLQRTWSGIEGRPENNVRDAVVLPFRERPKPQLRRWAGGAIAACLALAMLGGVYDWPTRLRADVVTATGEQRALPLMDGSIVQLNTDSAIAIDYQPNRRVIRLLKGEAAFSVAADSARPFTVEAGDGTATALGTRFIVRRLGAATDVTVTEHRVKVAWLFGGMVVGEGQAARYQADKLVSVHAVDSDDAAAWTRGRLVFVDRSLEEVVAELNRYHPGYIGVLGEDLAQRRFSGAFPVKDPLEALEAIQRSLGISSTRVTNRLIFLHS